MIFQVQPESQQGATACVVLAEMVGKRLGCLGEECGGGGLGGFGGHPANQVHEFGLLCATTGQYGMISPNFSHKKDALRPLLHRVGGRGGVERAT